MKGLLCTMHLDAFKQPTRGDLSFFASDSRISSVLGVLVWQEKPEKDETQNCGNHLKPLEDADMAGTGPYAPWIWLGGQGNGEDGHEKCQAVKVSHMVQPLTVHWFQQQTVSSVRIHHDPVW